MSACSSSSTQRAVVSPEPRATSPSPAPGTRQTEGKPLEVTPTALRYNLDPQQTKLEMFASDIVTGEHRAFFQRWRGHVDIVPAAVSETDGAASTPAPSIGAITAEIDTDSLVVDLAGATDFVKDKLLEVRRFPRATLTATLRRGDGPLPTQHIVQGIADIHGVKRHIRFVGDLTKEGGSYRFKTSFVISRKDFDVRYGPVEPFLKDDVRILIDGVANPERVTAEEIP